MRRSLFIVLSLLGGWANPSLAPAQVITVLHSFTGGPNDGQTPAGSLLLSGSTLYGMTSSGGTVADGTIFRIGTDGSGFGLMHSFLSGPNDGRNPAGSLIQSGSTLYGMTQLGGINGNGVIFNIGADGSGFSVMHRFGGGPGDGNGPTGTLTQVGSTMYGTTSSGGSVAGSTGLYQYGTVFTIGADGTNYGVLHSFAGAPNDGAGPGYGSLAQSAGTLYGMTGGGGRLVVASCTASGPMGPGMPYCILSRFWGAKAIALLARSSCPA